MDKKSKAWVLNPDRCFDPNPTQRELARQLYATVKNLPLVCAHGHVAPALLSDQQATLGSPASLFIIPDHYVFRMLYSQGTALEKLGVPTADGTSTETDHRQIWQTFAENFYLFRATPTGLWLSDELVNLFGITETLNGESAQRIYDQLEAQLAKPEYAPRNLFKSFNIEVLCTTDSPLDSLAEHQTLHNEGYNQILPTFRPDALLKLDAPAWKNNIEQLAQLCKTDVVDYASFLRCFEERRTFFKKMGATATDQAALTPYTTRLSNHEVGLLFQRALQGQLASNDLTLFTAHMFMEMARMSSEDGLVMQMHIGSFRNHNDSIMQHFGADKGADIPVQTEWTRNLHTLLQEYGNKADLRLILFGLDESNYSRELAPLAGHYPAIRLGPPWWFFDSVKGMERYFEQVIETAGFYNTAGFNDDTRAFASIPARHDVWRRVSCNWLAGQVVRGMLSEEDAYEVAQDLAYRLVKRVYNLETIGS
jgi:glucuronate isomerase